MSWTKDQERLLQWAALNQEPPRAENIGSSGWRMRDCAGTGIREYGFDTLNEIKDFLEEFTEEREASLIIGAAAMKEKEIHYKKSPERSKTLEFEHIDNTGIPDYVYVF